MVDFKIALAGLGIAAFVAYASGKAEGMYDVKRRLCSPDFSATMNNYATACPTYTSIDNQSFVSYLVEGEKRIPVIGNLVDNFAIGWMNKSDTNGFV